MSIFNGAAPSVQTASVSTSATQVFFTSGTVNSVAIPSSFANASNFIIYNAGPSTIYVGAGTGVTTSTGLPVASGDQLTLQGPVINVYAITSSGSASVTSGLATLVVSE